ncbi:unnamed protein product, partial [Rotaria socialis]
MIFAINTGLIVDEDLRLTISKNELLQKCEILSAVATVTGVSVALDVPIGEILFSFEEISNYFQCKTV